MNALDEIIKWANESLPPWQADAVRRLLISDSLDDNDIEELVYFVKNIYGLPCAKSIKNIQPKPPKPGEVSGSGASESSLILKRITCEKNVNAIPDGTSLPIGHEGLTIIYGENGTGKSGFARTLKKACNAKDKNEPLLGNVYASTFKTPSKVLFSIQENDAQEKAIEWTEGGKSETLSKISVFDSKCARILLDKRNEFQYKPYGTEIFEELVNTLRSIKAKIELEKPKPNKPIIDALHQGTNAKTFYDNLSSDTKEQEISKYSSWTEDNEQELRLLIEWKSKNERENCKLRIATNKGIIKKFIAIIKDIRKIRFFQKKCVIDDVNNAINNCISAEKAHKYAMQTASDEKFPLNGVRSNMWKILYDAAEKYSKEVAYKKHEFPYTGPEARCVFCMQELSEEAKTRLSKFSSYMTDETEKTLQTSKKIIERHKLDFNSIPIKTKNEIDSLLIEIKQTQPKIASKIVSAYDSLRSTNERIQEGLKNLTLIDSNIDLTFDGSEIFLWLKSLRKDALKLEEMQKPEEAEKNEQREKELSSLKILCGRSAEIKKYISDLQLSAKYDRCLNSIDSRSISIKGKNIVASLCTPELELALKEEFQKLNIHSLNIRIKASGSNGVIQHEFEISGAQGNQCPSEILSEGEQKAVSIAGFFAELQVANHSCPIVFDDPVTSLDHIYKEKIAERIANESTKRQVIVFTHDVVFLMELQKKLSDISNSKLTVITLRKKNGIPGYVDSTKPWNTRTVKERFEYLDESIGSFKELEQTDQKKYDEEAAHWYCLLRETWETIVEESLFNGVIKRFGYGIKTQSIQEIAIEDNDYATIEKYMGKASEWMSGHDRAKILDIHRPSIKEIKEDLSTAREFVKQIKNRKNITGQRRKESTTPQMPSIG